ncbi:MAG: hypothetical protein IPM77_15885 [Crocinitomicaceae bacterium]|jgi:hypothetical protein|nr:hypothetical protein [Crocinitomicaceae bacterium]
MEKGLRILVFCSIVFLLLLSSCDKNEQAYKKLINEGRWKVTQLTAGNTDFTKLPKWEIFPCENHEGYCEARWEHQNGSMVNFYYQFTSLGGKFTYFIDPAESETTTMAYSQCQNFSGQYKVYKSNRKTIHLESELTAGYPETLVVIILERE